MRTASAQGKVILLGEHGVVYGAPAIAVAINRGARARVQLRPGQRSSVRAAGPALAPILQDALDRALDAVLDQMPGHPSVRVDVTTDLPPAAGLGCSAALGVAVVRALDRTANVMTVATRAMAWERIFHGNPSGVDVAVSALGGCLLFQRDVSPTPLHPAHPLTLCIGHTGTVSSTKDMVERVARLRAREPARVRDAFTQMSALARDAAAAILHGALGQLGAAMNRAQPLLAGLGLSTPEIDAMCVQARAAGATGAKLTGAGGGGCVVALVSGPRVGFRVMDAWRRHGHAGFLSVVAQRGVGGTRADSGISVSEANEGRVVA